MYEFKVGNKALFRTSYIDWHEHFTQSKIDLKSQLLYTSKAQELEFIHGRTVEIIEVHLSYVRILDCNRNEATIAKILLMPCVIAFKEEDEYTTNADGFLTKESNWDKWLI